MKPPVLATFFLAATRGLRRTPHGLRRLQNSMANGINRRVLRDPAKSNDSVNRRVQITNTGE